MTRNQIRELIKHWQSVSFGEIYSQMFSGCHDPEYLTFARERMEYWKRKLSEIEYEAESRAASAKDYSHGSR